jgi:hypothetical protein
MFHLPATATPLLAGAKNSRLTSKSPPCSESVTNSTDVLNSSVSWQEKEASLALLLSYLSLKSGGVNPPNETLVTSSLQLKLPLQDKNGGPAEGQDTFAMLPPEYQPNWAEQWLDEPA